MPRKRQFINIALLILIAIFLSGCGVSSSISPSSATGQAYANQMDEKSIMTFEISADDADWQTMLDNAVNEEYISADVTINGTIIENVGIRPKGNSSLSQVARDETTDRFSFKIKFDEYVDGQTWMGLDKIVINNMFSDATYMKEYLAYDIMRYIGVESPLFAFADIKVNGDTWGLYLAVEVLDSSYLDRVNDGEGVLYKPENDTAFGMNGGFGGQDGQFPGNPNRQNLQEIPGSADNTTGGSSTQTGLPGAGNNTGDKIPDFQGGGMNVGNGMSGMTSNGVSLQYTDDAVSSYSAIFDNAQTHADESDYQRVITALKNLNDGTALSTYVDIDAVLKYFAAHTVVVNLDSYVSNMGHNYVLYENDSQISILPWDYNMAFGGFQGISASDVVNFPIDTPVSGVSMEDRPLLAKLLAVPEYKEKYHEYLQQIIDGYFSDGKFEQKVDQLNTLISEYVKNDPTAFYTYEKYQAGIVALKQLGVLRADSIQGQLDGTIHATTEGQKNDSSDLIDASSIDFSSLGSQNNGNGGMQIPGALNQNGQFMIPEGIDAAAINSAMAIISQASNGTLSEDQRNQLHALGLTDEQISQMLNMPKR